MNVFDYVKSINNHAYLNPDEDYSQFVITRNFSYFIDTALYAAEINQYQVPNKAHYDYLFNSIRPRKRFSKWNKKVEYENLDLIMKYYQISETKAIEVLGILTESQINEIKEKLTVGVI